MVRPLEWSGVVHCRVSRSVEVPSGLPSVVYTAKEHPQRAPPSPSPPLPSSSPSPPKRPGVSRARTMEGCHSVSRCSRDSRCYTTPCPIVLLLFARRRLDVTRLRIVASKAHVDFFHVNNVKMGIDNIG